MRRKGLLVVLALMGLLFAGCQQDQVVEEDEKDYEKPLPPGQLALRKITDPSQIPDFTIAACDTSNLRSAIKNSLNYMAKPSSQQFFPYGDISHRKVVASLQEFVNMLDSGLSGRELAAAIKRKYDVYISVGCDNMGTVLFTGYYTPIFDGSMKRTARFKYPLYSKPDDLVKGANGEILGRRTANGSIVDYPSRTDIEASDMLEGNELVWLSDPFEVYIAHVQGSAKIRLPDGKLITVGYAATNGHKYQSVSKQMLKNSAIPADKMSLKAMIDYFKVHPEEVDDYVSQNPRFVFFQISRGAPRGSLNEPVTPWRTIATDKSVYPRASLVFMSSKMPRSIGGRTVTSNYTGFVLDQDTGGAIRAPGRCDVYLGQGEEAGRLAGQVYHEGKLYYLFLKPEHMPSNVFASPDDSSGAGTGGSSNTWRSRSQSQQREEWE
ncbi:Membrane-bound lytic murein transglycosylase A precursor [Anaerohalosphaera lusitana]|uniref:peptidoglycan lytic exotransglycosylase n=1 Tax=Anaerohalosphaera lusitana TaxID=1936003 RepID=A0A1U9NPR2_9BACT|nr:MltA domain-containing protein [Anaerohalosphaera lusitana]AQT69903.1 Membrane-bound lytic murein transglycosylase A precursor [Anaerohalosphaera lusitana]